MRPGRFGNRRFRGCLGSGAGYLRRRLGCASRGGSWNGSPNDTGAGRGQRPGGPRRIVIEGLTQTAGTLVAVIGEDELADLVATVDLLPGVVHVCEQGSFAGVAGVGVLGMDENVRVTLEKQRSGARADGVAPLVE